MSENANANDPGDPGDPGGPGGPVPGPAAPDPVAPGPGPDPDPDVLASPQAGTGKPVGRGRRAAGAVVGGLLLTAAVVGGAGYTVVTVKDADRDAGAPVWAFPVAGPEKKAPAARTTGLAGALVPYRPESWTIGPDLGEFGADVMLSGDRLAALTKESLTGLPRSQRKELEKEIDRHGVKGVAMRSYASTGGFHDGEETGSVTLTVTLTQLKDAATARSRAAAEAAFFEALDDVFRPGPRIGDHQDAHCFRLPPDRDAPGVSDDPGDTDEGYEEMYCSAHQGDVLVTAEAVGVQPFGADSVAELLTEQLDRITEPGEAV